jgi:AAA15 family ATPase/GTPase
MLTRFEVSHFKSFNEKFVFDLSQPSDYQFNPEGIKNEIVNKAIIYGANGSGKSNLGLAIFDISSHLGNNEFKEELYQNYLNAESAAEIADFTYHFNVDNQDVIYHYGKTDVDNLVYENLIIGGTEVLAIDRRKNNVAHIQLEGAENLHTDMGEANISLINYVKNNTVRPVNPVNFAFDSFLAFVDKMKFYKYLSGNYFFLGFKRGTGTMEETIIKQGKVADLQDFLNRAGVDCKLEQFEYNGKPSIAFVFQENKIFWRDIASTGTHALVVFYNWLQRLKLQNRVGFLFIDEFDAFYHHELSEFIVEELKDTDAQVVLTTHNTSIMSNDLLRPDCYFLMTKKKIKHLNQCTPKELRLAHNLEKIYRGKGFEIDN